MTELDLTCECTELLEFMSRKELSKDYAKIEGRYIFNFSGYDREFVIHSEFEEKHEEAEMHNGDRGAEQMSPAHDFDEVSDIISVFEVDDNGNEKQITVDSYTASELLTYLTLED